MYLKKCNLQNKNAQVVFIKKTLVKNKLITIKDLYYKLLKNFKFLFISCYLKILIIA